MPTYSYRCGSCTDETDYQFDMGHAPRILICDACGGVAQLLIGVGVQIGPLTAEARTEQQRYDQDADAYKRMRNRGLQPDQINGSRRLENEVGDQFDVTMKPRIGHLSKEPWDKTKQRIREAQEEAKQSEWIPRNPKATTDA